MPEPRPLELRPRVFCIGLNKTGTSSFHAAMVILGFKSLHGGGPDWGGDKINQAVKEALAEGRPLLSKIDPAFNAGAMPPQDPPRPIPPTVTTACNPGELSLAVKPDAAFGPIRIQG